MKLNMKIDVNWLIITETHREDNPWKRNIKIITENTIELIAFIEINNITKHFIINIIVGINEKSINRTPNNTVILSFLYGFILDTSISKEEEWKLKILNQHIVMESIEPRINRADYV